MGPTYRLATPAVFAAAVVLTVLAALGGVALLGNELSYPFMIAVLAILLVGVLVKETVSNGDPITPGGIVAFTGLLLFVLRPLTVANSMETSPGAIADTRFFSPTLQLAASSALIEALIFFSAFFVVYYYSVAREARRIRRGGEDAKALEDNAIAGGPAVVDPDAQVRWQRVFNTSVAQALVVISSVVALGLLVYLVLSSGGIQAYTTGLANRSDFLSGKSFIGLSYIPVQIAIVYNVLARRQKGLEGWNWVNLVAVLVLVVCAGSAGGRGPLIIGVFLPFLILKQIGPKPFRFRTIALIGGVTAVVAMVYSIVIRESTFDNGRSLDRLTQDPLGVLLDRLTSGIETRPFDVLIRLNEVASLPDFVYQWGATYAAVPAWFVPRGLWEDKPFGGGNTWFTSTYVPRFYGVNRVETSLSAIGEAFANFGIPGVVAVGALLGLVAGLFIRARMRRRGLLGAAIAVVVTPYLFSLIRGDAYQGMSTSIASLVILVGFFWISSTRKQVTGPVSAPVPLLDETAPAAVREQALIGAGVAGLGAVGGSAQASADARPAVGNGRAFPAGKPAVNWTPDR
ncbi:O-antigen polymerase [Clavibacter michiganensis]|uniref:O-antigen polymerase n=1 Tax=Clavibacter michiganensis TaxID=28447 RepID=UPI00136603EB|nr:O-antigen polymerase [Clavibacter michiganensis]MDO4045420.1 O-antigen polymerase [Clavibacter michiganensis]MDO4052173.1 O-antigen polymerase [Clavibacter michiganensis]MDO4057303.1 O-antigen polymerase [Clavibacter michiganensis]MDO4069236.1 O-antigen polymerase [Clavibacter michiganensis]MWJ25372.1 oligosaccharide repeat unit polymerase [Clavibacter michiganensis subsp. michiganensis]